MKIRKAVIPAAGLGTRMLPATKTVPKEMLPIVDKPLIQYIVEEAAAAGIEDILVVTNRAKSAMDDYFDYYPELEDRLNSVGKTRDVDIVRSTAELANIFYVRQKQTKGLGHAIWCAKRFIGEEHFAVLLGDDIMRARTPVIRQLIDTAEEHHASVVGVQRVPFEALRQYSSVQVRHVSGRAYEVAHVVEKPRPEQVFSNFAILGRYVLSPSIFSVLENQPAGVGGEIQLTDGINALCGTERVMAVDFDGRRYDAGNPLGYLEAILDIGAAHPDIGLEFQAMILQKAGALRGGASE